MIYVLKSGICLALFFFGGDDVYKKVKVLSGGERSRLAIAKLLLEPYNLLVLDEPTNHLDLRSKEILKKALLNYEGTLLLVSHDRDFLNGLVDKVYEFRDKKIREHLGGIYDFLKKKKMESLHELETRQKVQQTDDSQLKTITENKQNYLDKKEFDKIVRKAANKVRESEKLIERLESDVKSMNKHLSDSEFLAKNTNNDALFKMYDKLKSDLAKEMDNWAILNEELETLKKSK